MKFLSFIKKVLGFKLLAMNQNLSNPKELYLSFFEEGIPLNVKKKKKLNKYISINNYFLNEKLIVYCIIKSFFLRKRETATKYYNII